MKSSELIAEGFVVSSEFALDSDRSHRSPAVVACFTYSETWQGVYSSNNEMCVLDVRHPESKYVSQMHRGSEYMKDIYETLKVAGFDGSYYTDEYYEKYMEH